MNTAIETASQPQLNYVHALLHTRVVPQEVATQLQFVLAAGTLEKSAAHAAINYMLRRPLRPRYRIPASQSHVRNVPLCEAAE